MARREGEAEQLRAETERLELRIKCEANEKAALMQRLSSQSPASVDGEIWQFLGDAGDWVSFPSAANEQLTAAVKEGHDVCQIVIDGRPYEIDFKLLSQMNKRTEKRRKIRCSFGLPNHWAMSDEDALKLLKGELQDAGEGSDSSFPISMGTQLTTFSEGTRMAIQAPFKKFVQKVRDEQMLRDLQGLLNHSLPRHDGSACECLHGSSTFVIKEAYQVKNLYLWRRYQRFVRSILDKQKQFGIVPEEIDPPVGFALTEFAKRLQVDLSRNERLLFHGTKKFGYAKAIATEGFDSRIAKAGGLYGKGTYFAAQTCKSAQYATKGGLHQKASKRQVGTMLVARVALGDPYYTPGAYNESRALTLCSKLVLLGFPNAIKVFS